MTAQEQAIEWQERIEALQALVTAPFVICLLVLFTVAVTFTAYIEHVERKNRR